MRVSLNWLRELVDVDVPVERLAELLNFSGTKVETMIRPKEGVGGVVVAEVLDVESHPKADNLVLVEVSTGDDSTYRVVCGARNFSAGDRVPYATVGAQVAGMDITERKIRGQVSAGMLCSGFELGVSKDHSGILVLPSDVTPGDDISEVLGLDDTIIELEITTNRPDCMSMAGIAREVAALTGGELRLPQAAWPPGVDCDGGLSIDIRDRTGCPRYVGAVLQGVSVGPSPIWMARRLLAAGLRSISNVVDVTNYVMLESGHPLHGFDAHHIGEHTIVVRRARPGESLTTLDGVRRRLHDDDLLIADPQRALAFAGIMGGEDSEVSEATATIILESAHFDPATVALASRRHNLRTEASARFERGADPEAAAAAAARAVELLYDIGAAKSLAGVVDAYPVPHAPRRITLRPKRTDTLLGLDTPARRQAELLASIGFAVTPAGSVLDVVVPSFRPDVTREADLIEEVARLAGFDRLPSSLPPGVAGGLEPEQEAQRTLRSMLSSFGLHEAATTSFATPADLDALEFPADDPARRMVEVDNPMTEADRFLRTALLPGLLRSAARNFAHEADGIGMFEIGPVYEPTPHLQPNEPIMLGAIFAGVRIPKRWNAPARSWDFYGAKGILEAALKSLGIEPPRTMPASGMPWHPTRAAAVALGNNVIGMLGELHPAVCERFDIPERACALEISLQPVLAALPPRVRVADLPRFPPVYLDLAVVVEDDIPEATVADVIRRAGVPEVVSVRLFDLYRGGQISEGKKSLAYALQLQLPDRTLTAEEANSVRDRILGALSERTGAQLRS